MNGSLDEGSTDGKYRKARPNTHTIPGAGDQITQKNRQTLHPFYGYGFINTESPVKVNPGK
jgi:hypothetical protein